MSRTVAAPGVTKSEISVPSFSFEKTPQDSAAMKRDSAISFVSF